MVDEGAISQMGSQSGPEIVGGGGKLERCVLLIPMGMSFNCFEKLSVNCQVRGLIPATSGVLPIY